MIDGWHAICDSDVLFDGGLGVRFDVVVVHADGRDAATGFVIRSDGRVYGWLNQCRHLPMELDWRPGRFFDAERRYLICSTHGALYEADSGVCVAGPCKGARLRAIEVREIAPTVYWRPSADIAAA